MVSYNNSNVVQCLRQYDMFAKGLGLVKTREEREGIVKQLTKLESKIISLTNEVYEEEYYSLANKECGLIDEEQTRLNMLIDLINQRLSYVEKRCNNHYQLTEDSIDVDDVLGASTLDILEERLRIIDKYSKNVKLEKELKKEVESLTNKIMLASEKVEINKSLNQELEKNFCDVLACGFEKCGYFNLVENRDMIEYAYYETEKSLTLAELNLETAKTSPINVLDECQKMLDDVKKDYVKYKEKLSLLKLMDLFNREVNSYEELLSKRKEVNDLFRYIKNEEFLGIVMDTVNKQYNTILMEQQDVNTFNDLTIEKDRKLEALAEISEENNSEKFQNVLIELIRNEEAKQAKILEEQRRIEEEEKKRLLELEKKKHEEILKRQKIIEEARKKEVEKRTKELLEQQQKSILQNKRRDTGFSFETIKDISNKDVSNKRDIDRESYVMDTLSRESYNRENIIDNGLNTDNNDKELFTKFDRDDFNNSDVSVVNDNVDTMMDVLEDVKLDLEEKDENIILFKDKTDIERELFDEFNNGPTYELNLNSDNTNVIDVVKDNDEVFFESKIDNSINDRFFGEDSDDDFFSRDELRDSDFIIDDGNDNKLPSVSIDEYMKNFDENRYGENEVNSLFSDDDMFPNIPI